MHIFGKKIVVNKKISHTLQQIEGLGFNNALKICWKVGISPETKWESLTDNQINNIKKVIQYKYKIRKELDKEIERNIKRLVTINSYRGIRHKNGLPVRGQRTHTNGKTQKRLHSQRLKK